MVRYPHYLSVYVLFLQKEQFHTCVGTKTRQNIFENCLLRTKGLRVILNVDKHVCTLMPSASPLAEGTRTAVLWSYAPQVSRCKNVDLYDRQGPVISSAKEALYTGASCFCVFVFVPGKFHYCRSFYGGAATLSSVTSRVLGVRCLFLRYFESVLLAFRLDVFEFSSKLTSEYNSYVFCHTDPSLHPYRIFDSLNGSEPKRQFYT